MDAISVSVRRGDVVESRHRVHAALVRDGQLEEAWGDPELVTHMRSAAKPFQALGLVRDAPDLPDEELAIACASHEALPEQLAAVEALVARAAASEADLECGPVGGSPLRHGCSGKHAGMLLRCRRNGWERQGYRLAGHPLQDEITADVSRASSLAPEDLATAVDGCGVVTFAMPLRTMALMFARSVRGDLPGGERVVEAFRRHPRLIGGPQAHDTLAMEAVPGAIAKRGAEGLLCVGLPDGAGLALKAEDGATRAAGAALGSLLGIEALNPQRLTNSRGDDVGEILAAGREIRSGAFPQAVIESAP
jgi:L-asparaginase II